MFLDHVNSFGKFLKFFVQKHFFLPLLKKKREKKKEQEHCVCRFLKNTVPCEFLLLKLCNFHILYLISFKVMTKTISTKSYPGTKLNVKSRRKFLHLSSCSRTGKFFSMPCHGTGESPQSI